MLSRFVRLGRSIAIGFLAVVTALAVAAAAMLVASLTVSARTIDQATKDALAIGTMEVALAEESQHVAVWVANRGDAAQGSVREAVTVPALRFATAAERLLAGGSSTARQSYLALGADHDELLASIERLEAMDASGAALTAAYLGEHRPIEDRIETRLGSLEAATTTRMELALLESAAARDRLVSLLPVILLAAVAALYALWRLRIARRRGDALQRLIVEKDVFIGTVSHELRSPLSGILGLSAELVERGDALSPEERSQYQEIVLAQALEMRDLIEDLLVAARTDIENIGIRTQELELTEVVRRVLEESALMQSSAAPAVVVEEGAVRVVADRMRFRQILRNLLSNAARYGGNRVRITFASAAGQGMVAVRDDGAGVPAGSEGLIFEPYRSAAGNERPTASVGLGLSVSRTLARLMGGDLVYRRDGGETVFELSLPLVSGDAAADERAPAAIAVG